MKKFLLVLVLILPMVLAGCGDRNPIADSVWIGENQYYYDVLSFTSDSLTYTGIDINGDTVVPQIKMAYKWEENDMGAFYTYLDTLIIHRPNSIDSIQTFNFIKGFNANDVGDGYGTLCVWRYWRCDGMDWKQEYIDFRPIEFYQTPTQNNLSPSEIIKQREYHGILSIVRDTHSVIKGDIGTFDLRDFYKLQEFIRHNQIDSIDNMLSDGRAFRFEGRYIVDTDTFTRDYVFVEKRVGLDKFYVSWGSLEDYASSERTYHNIKTGREQLQYKDSKEKQRDLNMIDNYGKNNPDFW